jgi:hypothetical protein
MHYMQNTYKSAPYSINSVKFYSLVYLYVGQNFQEA